MTSSITPRLIRSLFASVALLASCEGEYSGTEPQTQQNAFDDVCLYCAPAVIICTDEPGIRFAGRVAECDEVGTSGACMVEDTLLECEVDPCGESFGGIVLDQPEERMPCAGIATE